MTNNNPSSPSKPLSPLMTRKEVAAYLKISEDTVDRLLRKDVFDVISLQGCKRIRRADVEFFVKYGKARPKPENGRARQ